MSADSPNGEPEFVPVTQWELLEKEAGDLAVADDTTAQDVARLLADLLLELGNKFGDK